MLSWQTADLIIPLCHLSSLKDIQKHCCSIKWLKVVQNYHKDTKPPFLTLQNPSRAVGLQKVSLHTSWQWTKAEARSQQVKVTKNREATHRMLQKINWMQWFKNLDLSQDLWVCTYTSRETWFFSVLHIQSQSNIFNFFPITKKTFTGVIVEIYNTNTMSDQYSLKACS